VPAFRKLDAVAVLTGPLLTAPQITSCAAASATPSTETTQAYALPTGKVADTNPRRRPQTRDETVTTSDIDNDRFSTGPARGHCQ